MAKLNTVLLIYTGGTIGMVKDAQTGTLVPFDFEHLLQQIPELKNFNVNIEVFSFTPAIDSSNMHPNIWEKLCKIIYQNYPYGTEKQEDFLYCISWLVDYCPIHTAQQPGL